MYHCFEINIEVNKPTRNNNKCTQKMFEGFKNSPKHRQSEQHY